MAMYMMILLLTSILSELYGHETKSSVSFVIDTTGSMDTEIKEVKLQTRKLFDAIKSDKSHISEFILVEFKDLNAAVKAVTKDGEEFLKALSNLEVGGGGDCPEAALTGILLALEKSAPNSFIYVFTDSSAKDYKKFEEVKSLSTKKSIQITFLLTGICKMEKLEKYLVYHEIAKATSGQVFIMKSKQNIFKILEYIIESLKSKNTLLAHKLFNSGPHNVSFVVDTKVTTVMISISGPFANNNVSVVDIKGNSIECSVLVQTELVYVLQMPNTTRAGSYNIAINSSGKTSVFVSGSTTICFEHGFSLDKPTFINETSKRPLPGIRSHLSIALTNSARDLLLGTAELRDTDDNIITTVPLKLIDSEQQLYVTEQFDPPDFVFKIVIKGETNTRENITRVGMTYIEPQNAEEPSSKLVPQITILGYAIVRADRTKPLTLKCRVEANAKPYIIWKDDLGTKFEPEVMIVELNSSFKSTLQIERVDKNMTYYCTAISSENTIIASVFVYLPEMIQDPPIIENSEYVKNSTKGEIINIACLVEGNPLPDVKWLKNSIKIKSGSKYQIFENHTLRFEATLEDSGNYSCVATNSMGIAQRDFYINVHDPPVIENSGYVKNSTKNEVINIACLVEGNPLPDVKWLKNSIEIKTGSKYQIFGNHTLRFEATLNDSGNYSCVATNYLGIAQRDFYINVHDRPDIENSGYVKNSTKGEMINIACLVEGNPLPDVKWLKNSIEIKTGSKYQIFGNHTLRFEATLDDSGNYSCVATNYVGTAQRDFYIIVHDPPVIENSGYVKNSTKGEVINIACLVEGNPLPDVKWLKNSIEIKTGSKYQIFGNHTLRFEATLDDSGNYSCVATNYLGIAQREFYINVHDPPVIENSGNVKNSTKGEVINIACLVEGNPLPDVKWLKNSIEIKTGSKYQIFGNHTLRFEATLDDSGIYSCVATNYLGVAQRDFYINVHVPVSIEITENTTKVLKVGEKLSLRCSATGYPVPEVHFIFTNATNDEQEVYLKTGYYNVKYITESNRGKYTCAASNHYTSERLVYNVTVIVPVNIEKKPSSHSEIDAIEGDKILRLPCKANGYPEPKITWIRNGEILNSFNDRLYIEKDGALFIRNPTSDLSGNYICSAENIIMGIRRTDWKSIDVKIGPFPDPESYPYKLIEIIIKKGDMNDIKCDIPHSSEEEIRWYKDGKIIKTGELSLNKPQKTDDGIYICRFSNLKNISKSYVIKIIVVFKPRFINDTLGADINIPYKENSTVHFDCRAEGYPEPEIEWNLDGNLFKGIRGMEYNIYRLNNSHVGIYKCKVKNKYGSITRIFNINSTDVCHLNIYDDFNDNQPLILLSNLRWPLFETTSGSVKVSKKEIVFYCPGGRLQLERDGLSLKEKVTAKCIRDTLFNVTGKAIKFSDIKCSKKIKPHAYELIFKNNKGCIDKPSKLYTVGYKIGTTFRGVYEVCFDTVRNVPIFTKQALHRYIAAKVPKTEPKLETYNNIKYNFKELYDKSEQIKLLSPLLRRHFDSNSCLFSERQLVNPLDILPGMSQVTTYNYLNIMPHWSPCYRENWVEVEKKVREVAQSLSSDTIVWTGTSGWISIQSLRPGAKGKGLQRQLVPLFLWKVVQNKEEGGSVAIVQINSPTLTLEEVKNKVKCYDICNKIKWLRNDEWHNVAKGYTYCCNITEFEENFNFNLLFRAAPVDVLYNVSKARTRP